METASLALSKCKRNQPTSTSKSQYVVSLFVKEMSGFSPASSLHGTYNLVGIIPTLCCCSDPDVNSDVFLKVSKQAKEFLEFVYEEPLLDVQQLNPCLYEHCEPLSIVLRLRQQLQSLRAYLFSCRATVAEDLRRRYVGGDVCRVGVFFVALSKRNLQSDS